MLVIVIGWAFGTFLYFKVAFDAAFYDGITIVAALICGILSSVCILFGSGVYAHKLLRFNWTPGAVPARVTDLLSPTLLPFILICVVHSLLLRLVIFGFSKRLSRDISVFEGYGRNKQVSEEIVIFLLISVAPIVLHYAMSVWGTYRNANKVI